MTPTRHCALCEHKISSFEKGITSALTKRKPDFKDTCPDIKLGNTFQKKLEDAILELANISRYKRSSYLTFLFLVIIGVFLIIKSKTFAEWAYNDSTFIWESIIGTVGIGISFIIASIYKLSQFKRRFEHAKHTKNKIDLILDTYGISYTYNFDVEKEIHGTQKTILILEFNNWIKKRTKTSFILDL